MTVSVEESCSKSFRLLFVIIGYKRKSYCNLLMSLERRVAVMSKEVEIEKDGEKYILEHSYNYDAKKDGKHYISRFFSIVHVDEAFKEKVDVLRRNALFQAVGLAVIGVVPFVLILLFGGDLRALSFAWGLLAVFVLCYFGIEKGLFDDLFSKEFSDSSVYLQEKQSFNSESFYSDSNSSKKALYDSAMINAIDSADPRVVDVMLLNRSICNLLQSSREIAQSMDSLSQVPDAGDLADEMRKKVSSFSFKEELREKEELRDALMNELIKEQSQQKVETALLSVA